MEWAKKHVILVSIDSPRRKELPAPLKKQNDKLKQKFQISGFPTVLFLDYSEKILGRSGYKPGGPEKWIEDAAKQIK